MSKKTAFEQEEIENRFVSFCKTVIRNELFDVYREENRYAEVFVPLDIHIDALSMCDCYETDYVKFYADDFVILIENESLSQAMPKLTDRQREVVLRYFLLNEKDAEIAKNFGISAKMVGKHRAKALVALRKMMKEDYNG